MNLVWKADEGEVVFGGSLIAGGRGVVGWGRKSYSGLAA